MPISLGTTTVTALYLGTTSISSAYLGNTQVFGGSFTPLSLFSGGAQGVWYDPSDLTTMFVDRAGTTPVTAPGQLVGLRLDKSKGLALGSELVLNPGNPFASAANWSPATASLSVVSGNLRISGSGTFARAAASITGLTVGKTYKLVARLVETTATDSAIWATSGFSYTTIKDMVSGSVLEVIGTATATSMSVTLYTTRTADGTGKYSDWSGVSVRELPGNHATAPTDAARVMYGVEPKGGRRNLLLATDTLATQSLTVTAVAHTLAFTGTGTVTLSGASTAGPLVGTGAGNRVSLTFTPTAASLTLTVSGSVTLGQLELGSSATAYQKVVTAEDVTEAGVPTCHYCRYDGANTSMSTAAIDFTATDKMSAFAGASRIGTTSGVLVEWGAGVPSGLPGFFFYRPSPTEIMFRSSGTIEVTVTATPATQNSVFTGLGDIGGDRATLRINGAQVGQNTNNQGTGTYGSYPLFLGRRNNSNLPFNGRDYGIIVVGKAASAGEITDTETWLAAKTSGVTL